MERSTILELLENNHRSFIHKIECCQEDDFEKKLQGKWSIGQHLEHILLSIKPLTKVLALPDSTIKTMFGEVKRASRSYERLVEDYQYILSQGGKATSNFIPQEVKFSMKNDLISYLKKNLHQLTLQIKERESWDGIFIPHPLLGNLTLTEMIYFTIYHVEHHQKALTLF